MARSMLPGMPIETQVSGCARGIAASRVLEFKPTGERKPKPARAPDASVDRRAERGRDPLARIGGGADRRRRREEFKRIPIALKPQRAARHLVGQQARGRQRADIREQRLVIEHLQESEELRQPGLAQPR